MKLLSIIIGLALLVSASPSYAGGIVMMGGGVAAVGGETEPASGTVILGSSSATNYTVDWIYPSVSEEIFNTPRLPLHGANLHPAPQLHPCPH